MIDDLKGLTDVLIVLWFQVVKCALMVASCALLGATLPAFIVVKQLMQWSSGFYEWVLAWEPRRLWGMAPEENSNEAETNQY